MFECKGIACPSKGVVLVCVSLCLCVGSVVLGSQQERKSRTKKKEESLLDSHLKYKCERFHVDQKARKLVRFFIYSTNLVCTARERVA